MKRPQTMGEKDRTLPSRSLVSRTAMLLSKFATSTQFPLLDHELILHGSLVEYTLTYSLDEKCSYGDLIVSISSGFCPPHQ